MAEINFVALAEFARVEPNGLLTLVGAEFTELKPPVIPSVAPMYLALSIYLREGEPEAPFEVRLTSPGEAFNINLTGSAVRPEQATAIFGRVHVALAVNLVVPITAAGMYEVQVKVGDISRTTGFRVAELGDSVGEH